LFKSTYPTSQLLSYNKKKKTYAFKFDEMTEDDKQKLQDVGDQTYNGGYTRPEEPKVLMVQSALFLLDVYFKGESQQFSEDDLDNIADIRNKFAHSVIDLKKYSKDNPEQTLFVYHDKLLTMLNNIHPTHDNVWQGKPFFYDEANGTLLGQLNLAWLLPHNAKHAPKKPQPAEACAV
jgi:hypothetical protein